MMKISIIIPVFNESESLLARTYRKSQHKPTYSVQKVIVGGHETMRRGFAI
jgi:glycosyltransferase involved in cell wall biosynthesis